MKRLILLLLLSATSFTVFSQITNQVQAKRGVFTDQLYLNGKWINGISTNMNSDDSTSDNVIPTAKAAADYVRSKIKTPTLQQVLSAGSTLTQSNIINAGNNYFAWNNNLANGYLYRFRIDNTNSEITRTIYTSDFSTASDFTQSYLSNSLITSGKKVVSQFYQYRDGGMMLWSTAAVTGSVCFLTIDTAMIELVGGKPDYTHKQHKFRVFQDTISLGAYMNKSDGTSYLTSTNLVLRGLPASTSNSDSVLVKLPDGRLAYRGSAGSAWTISGNNIYNANTDNVAIGITNPAAKFHVQSREFGTEGVTAYINPIWNTTGNPTAFKVNPLVISNGSTSLLADFQYSGLSRFSIRHDGLLTLSAYSNGTFTGSPAYDLQTNSSGEVIQKVAPKVYTALLSQTGTGDPVATVLGTNSLGAITWTRTGAGNYTGTLTSAFPNGKTFVITGSANGNAMFIKALRSSDNTINVSVQDGAQQFIDEFNNASIEIRVYP